MTGRKGAAATSPVSRRSFLQAGALLAAGAAVGCGPRGWRSPVAETRVRLRDLGITIGSLPTGPLNAITDVQGVLVGQITLIAGEGPLQVGVGPVRNGVTAILPHGGDLARQQVLAADFTLNGNGELTGLGYLRRTGRLGGPILFTDTGSVGQVYHGALQYMEENYPDFWQHHPAPEPVVGETWGDFLNDTAGRHAKPEHARQALETAEAGPVAEGSVGGGTSMRAYSFKAGIGTASRRVDCGGRIFSVGALVQANHGRRHQLMVDGVPVGAQIPGRTPKRGGKTNSLLIALASDAPLLPIQLQRLGKRAALGMGRTGGISTQGSGDLFLAFSTD